MSTASRDHPVIIGIVGDSGAGKTTLAAGLAHILGVERTLTICIDDYHRYDRKTRAGMTITPHDPACNYMDILEQHVFLLRDGQPILKPIYNHNGGVLEAPEYVVPKDFIILEGLLGYSSPRLREAYDVKFYIEPEAKLRVRWKFQRDVQGGYTVEQVMASLDRLNADSERFILPQRQFADMVVSFYPPDNRPDETGSQLNAALILRPTLPYLDLAPLLEQSPNGGLVLELARDKDGRPVDALHISGALAEGEAQALEDALWSLIPSAPLDHGRIGTFIDGERQDRHSHTLALAQLVIAHYLLNAPIGAPLGHPSN